MGGITCPSPVGRAFPRHGQLGHGPCFLKRVKAEGTPAILSTPDWPRRPWYAAFPSVQPSFPRSAILPHFTSAVEAEVLQSQGVLDPVIQTMLEPENRSPPGSITVIGRRTSVGAISTFSIPLSVTPRGFSPFLQSGMEQGLALSSLKGQVSALSVLFQRTFASRPQVKTFLQVVAHCAPPFRHSIEPWDLNLVLLALQDSPFEPLRDISPRFLFWRFAFLVAITSIRRVSKLAALSCRSPFLVPFQGGPPSSSLFPLKGCLCLPYQHSVPLLPIHGSVLCTVWMWSELDVT